MTGDIAVVVLGVGCLMAAAGVAIAVIAARKARRPAAPQTEATDPFRDADTDALRGDPRALKPGDLVEIRGRSYAVRGTLRFTEGAWGWAEHLLDDAAGAKVWLSVEEDPDLELALWTEVPTATVLPGEPTVDFDGRRYRREEAGRARYTGTGTTGLNPSGTVRYEDYAAPDGALLSFESFGDSGAWEVGRGERLHRAELLIYPQGG
ncbi:DUF4178 domain-containing protein [Actinomycetes bacterium KLBMP 9797]